MPSCSTSARATWPSSLNSVPSGTWNDSRTWSPARRARSVTTHTPPADMSTERTIMSDAEPSAATARQRTGSRTMTRKNSRRSSSTLPTSAFRPGRLRGGLLLAHERVAVVLRRHEGLLDRPRAHPPDQVPHRAGLIVRPRRARSAERLLADDGPGRLVVHVEVAGGVAKRLRRVLDPAPVGGEDGARERVRRGRVDELERVVHAFLVVDIRRHDRPEELPP